MSMSHESVSLSDETANTDQAVNMAVYFHPTCSLHNIPEHPEQPKRVDSILAALRTTWPSELIYRESPKVTSEQILLFHTPKMVDRFEKLADKTAKTYAYNKSISYLPIDQDTTVMHRTKTAAYHSAGAVIAALDHMYADEGDAKKIDTAFCCVRPPGHHAERGLAGGFCFFNNVAIGAKYAQKTYGVRKVAVVDFDVHHGNGEMLNSSVDIF